MQIFGKTISSAIIVIMLMVLINAGVVLYFSQKFEQADKNQRERTHEVAQISTSNRLTIQKLTVERNIRSDQTCELFETDHLQKVQGLRQTYQYISALKPAELAQPLNKFVLLNLPKTEQEAIIDRAPEYCDEPDTGLPEPDPVIPDRPKQVVKLVGERPDYPTAAQVAQKHKKLKGLQQHTFEGPNPQRK